MYELEYNILFLYLQAMLPKNRNFRHDTCLDIQLSKLQTLLPIHHKLFGTSCL